ncbi:MAG: ferredoxin family protein [Anaerolineales bacterium]|nr:ferredoxin family protein [Anaerolineales bacterium]
MSGSTNNNWHEIPREEIEWHPQVISEKCIGCGLCVTSCGRGVYRFDYETNKAVVSKPLMCMVGCTTCATICTQDAVEFPPTEYIRQVIKDEKILTKTKDLLRNHPEKYGTD